MGFLLDCAGRGQPLDYYFHDTSGFVSLQAINVWIKLNTGKISKNCSDISVPNQLLKIIN